MMNDFLGQGGSGDLADPNGEFGDIFNFALDEPVSSPVASAASSPVASAASSPAVPTPVQGDSAQSPLLDADVIESQSLGQSKTAPAPAPAKDLEFMTAEGATKPSQPLVEKTKAEIAARAEEALLATGYSPELVKVIMNPKSGGVTQVTSPLEFLATGGLVSAKLAGKAGLALFMAASPIEYTGTVVGEELGESNLAIGIGTEILFGVGAGMLAQKVTQKVSASGIWTDLATRTQRVLRPARYAASLDQAIDNVAMQSTDGAAIAIPGAKAAITLPAESNLATRKVALNRRQLEAKMAQSDLKDSSVREVYTEALGSIKVAGTMTTEEAKLVKGLEDKIVVATEQASKIEPPLPVERPYISNRLRRAVETKVRQEWFGPKEKDFRIDLDSSLNEAITVLKANDTPFDLVTLRANLETDLRQEYEAAMQTEVQDLLLKVDPNSLKAKTTSFIKGGTGPDIWNQPPGTIRVRAATEQGQSRYKAVDWDIADFRVDQRPSWAVDSLDFDVDVNNLVFKTDPIALPKAPKANSNKSRLFPYDSYKSEADARVSLNKMIAHWTSDKLPTWERVGERWNKAIPQARALKRPITVFNKDADTFVTFNALPPEEVDAIAKLYGWSDSVIQPEHSVSSTGELFQTSAEDINFMRASKLDQDIIDPGKFDADAKFFRENPDEEMPTAHRQRAAATEAYRRQQQRFLKAKLGITPEVEARDPFLYNAKLDQLAVMRNELTKEMAHLKGSGYERQSKKMYVLFGDVLAGTNRSRMLNNMDAAQIRRAAYSEIEDFQRGKLSAEETDMRIAEIADQEGLSAEDAAEAYATRLLENDALTGGTAKEVGQASDLLGTPSRVVSSAEAGIVSPDSLEVPVIKQMTFNELSTPERVQISSHMAQIEDHFKVKVVEDLYAPTVGSRAGKINIFKANSLSDLEGVLRVFDSEVNVKAFGFSGTMEDALLGPVDTQIAVGVIANTGHTPQMASKLSYVIKDATGQMADLSMQLKEHPDDILSALAFDKIRAIAEIFTTQLADGKPAESAIEAFMRLDLTAYDDYNMVDRISKIVDDNYAIYGTRRTNSTAVSEFATEFADLRTPAQRGAFLKAVSDAESYLEMNKVTKELNAFRKILTDRLVKECGDA